VPVIANPGGLPGPREMESLKRYGASEVIPKRGGGLDELLAAVQRVLSMSRFSQ